MARYTVSEIHCFKNGRSFENDFPLILTIRTKFLSYYQILTSIEWNIKPKKANKKWLIISTARYRLNMANTLF